MWTWVCNQVPQCCICKRYLKETNQFPTCHKCWQRALSWNDPARSSSDWHSSGWQKIPGTWVEWPKTETEDGEKEVKKKTTKKRIVWRSIKKKVQK